MVHPDRPELVDTTGGVCVSPLWAYMASYKAWLCPRLLAPPKLRYTDTMMRTMSTLAPQRGVVSYRLTRQRTVQAFRDGEQLLEDVCDANLELQRVAHHHSRPLSEPCPICGERELVAVTFAFGPGLPTSGRVVSSDADLVRLAHRGRPTTCYSIEVCRQCWWNHLSESYTVASDATV